MLITVTITACDDYNEKISFIRSSKRLVIINQWLLRRLTDRVNRLYLCGNREGQSIIQMSILLIFGERYKRQAMRQATRDFREHFVFMNN